ncbi:MAG: radical SAM protein, partial [Verrucomicrobiota bacterium]
MEPLAPAYLAGLVPDHVEVRFWDDRMERIPYDDPTDLVAISVETYTAKRAYQIASEFRRRGVPVVMGGFHATLVPDEVMEYAEAVVVGEAEQTFPRLIDDFKAGRMQRLYRAEGRPSLKTIEPERSIFKGKRYLKLGLVEAGRGCTFKCNFCAVTSYFNATQSHRPIEKIVEEIKSMKDEKKLFFFVDDNTVSHPRWAKELYTALKPLKIRWVSQASITLTHDEELLRLMKESGCQGVLIGFESLNPDNLAGMNKKFNMTRGGYEPALARLNKYGIRLYATFMFGYGHDDLASFPATIEFCIRHRIFMAAFNHLTPFPGTPLYQRLEEEGRLFYDKWWLDDR